MSSLILIKVCTVYITLMTVKTFTMGLCKLLQLEGGLTALGHTIYIAGGNFSNSNSHPTHSELRGCNIIVLFCTKDY